ncbi:MAG: AEC family transporter [Pseudomonadota bacterium]
MGALIDVILPVFLVIGFGYVAVWRGLFSDDAVEGLMAFTQKFAIPCLLFRAISTLDLGQTFDAELLSIFYTGATASFVVAMLGARFLFARPWTDSVAIGFCCLFSNSLLLGLPITERAYGADALAANYAIVAIHAPYCYLLGITAMELARASGAGLGLADMLGKIARAIFANSLILGILAGFAVNLGQIPMPGPLIDAIDLMIRAALPAALFGLGGVLYRYRPEGDLRTIAFTTAVALVLHPSIVWVLGRAADLSDPALRSALITGAMPPGINAYIFANMYGVGRRVAATTVLFGTAFAIFTTAAWISILP